MQFRVVIPEKVKAGQCIRIRCPDGTEADMRVPKGLVPGDSFIVDVSGPNEPVTIARVVKKDVLYLRDFIVATIIGLLIGTSIVIGFLIGVLSVTSSDDNSMYNKGDVVNSNTILHNTLLQNMVHFNHDTSNSNNKKNGIFDDPNDKNDILVSSKSIYYDEIYNSETKPIEETDPE